LKSPSNKTRGIKPRARGSVEIPN